MTDQAAPPPAPALMLVPGDDQPVGPLRPRAVSRSAAGDPRQGDLFGGAAASLPGAGGAGVPAAGPAPVARRQPRARGVRPDAVPDPGDPARIEPGAAPVPEATPASRPGKRQRRKPGVADPTRPGPDEVAMPGDAAPAAAQGAEPPPPPGVPGPAIEAPTIDALAVAAPAFAVPTRLAASAAATEPGLAPPQLRRVDPLGFRASDRTDDWLYYVAPGEAVGSLLRAGLPTEEPVLLLERGAVPGRLAAMAEELGQGGEQPGALVVLRLRRREVEGRLHRLPGGWSLA